MYNDSNDNDGNHEKLNDKKGVDEENDDDVLGNKCPEFQHSWDIIESSIVDTFSCILVDAF